MAQNNIKPSEVSQVLLQQLKDIDTSLHFEEIGKVLQVSDGVARMYGLTNAEAGELLEFESGAPAPAPEPAPAPVVKKEEPVIVEPAFESLQRNILFIINKWDIRPSEQLKIDEVVAALKENPGTKVRISGYADKATGTAKRNQFLSEKRSEIVAQAIIDAGIDKDRIITEYFGDTVNPFETPELNRVAVCLVK